MRRSKQLGFTLLEMVLVLIIMSSILILMTNYGTQRMAQFRRDRAAVQMQQILAAGMSYYVSQGTWPVTCSASPSWTNLSTNTTSPALIQSSGYLPLKVPSPFPGNPYSISCSSTTGVFSVRLTTFTNADALTIAGQLPLAYIAGTSSPADKQVIAQVQVPGQNLNNARSINFANIYHNGACVPVPNCPLNMTAQIFVIPASASGVNDEPSCSGSSSSSCSSINSYPITSFTAFATGPTAASAGYGPTLCDNSGNAPCYSNVTSSSWTGPITDGNMYWRVCLSVTTEKGPVVIPSSTTANGINQYWSQALGKVYVTTRCAPTAEPSGSTLEVWGPTN